MLSSNQVLEISGEFDQLEQVLRLVIKMVNITRDRLAFQITKDGKYCIGWGEKEHGWEKFQFDFDEHIVSEIIIQHLKKLPEVETEWDWYDGSTERGFLMKVIPETFADEENGIKNPFCGIVSFEPFTVFYSK